MEKTKKKEKKEKKNDFWGKIGDVVRKAVDCCLEWSGMGRIACVVVEWNGEECVYRDWETDRKSTRLNSSHITRSRMPSSA